MTQKRRKRRNTKRPQRRTSTRSDPVTRRSERADEAPPEIKTGYTAAGRETLAAIAEELGPAGLAAMRPVDPEPAPEIEIGQAAAGRETLAAIRGELVETEGPTARHAVDNEERPSLDSVPPARPRFRTVGFSEPPPDQPGSPPARLPRDAKGARPPGRETLEAIEEQLANWAETGQPPRPPAKLAPGATSFDVFEMATFVVRGDLAQLSSTAARRSFVAERLLHRLPVTSLDDVDRIDVTPWTVRGTVIVRVWCRVPPP